MIKTQKMEIEICKHIFDDIINKLQVYYTENSLTFTKHNRIKLQTIWEEVEKLTIK